MEIHPLLLISALGLQTFRLLLDLAPYLSDMPAEYTTMVTGGDGTADPKHLHFPDPLFLAFIATNVVIPFLVNLVSSRVYDRLFAGEPELKSGEELESIRREVLTEESTTRVSVNLRKGRIRIQRETERRVERLLTDHGVPISEASEKAREVSDALEAMVCDKAADDRSDG